MRYEFLLCIKLFLYCYGDIEINPCPKISSFNFCHWDLNGIAAPNFVKISLIQRYIKESNVDIICLFETSLNYSLNNEDDRLKMRDYNLIRSDHPSGLQKGGLCAHYKVHIPLIRRDNLCALNNCLATEIILENKKCFLTYLYDSPSQNQHKFEIFFRNFRFFCI